MEINPCALNKNLPKGRSCSLPPHISKYIFKFYLNLLELNIISYFPVEEFRKIFISIFIIQRKPNIKEVFSLYEKTLINYLKIVIRNTDMLDKVIEKDQKLIFNIFQKSYLPIYNLITDGGMVTNYDGTDSIHDEITYYNCNNFLWINLFMSFFKEEKSDIINILGNHFQISSKNFYKMIKNFKFDEKIIKEYKSKNKKIFQILDKHGVKFQDLIYAIIIKDNDIPENLNGVSFPDLEGEEEFFFEENESYFPSRYGDKIVIQKEYFDNSLKSDKCFSFNNIKLLNLKKNVKFIIYFIDSDEYVNNISEKAKHKNNLKIEEENLKLDLFFKEHQNKILLKKESKCLDYIEFNIRKFHFNPNNPIPIMYVNIKEDSEYEELNICQNFLSRYIIIRQLQQKQTSNDQYNLEEILDTWELKETLPKILFFGNFFNFSKNI
jgi:hypothetical protein